MLSPTASLSRGLPATNILRLSADRPMVSRPAAELAADDVILTAVEHPPRIGEIRPISLLVSEVLARYGLAQVDDEGPATRNTANDVARQMSRATSSFDVLA